MRTLRHRWLLSAALAALMLGASGVSAPPAWSAPTSPPPSSQSQPEVTTSDGDHIDPTTTGSAPQEDAPATTATSARSATAEATSDAGSASTPAPATAPATVRAAAPTGVKVVEAGSIALTPKLSTDADTSGCASAHTCRPTAITAGLLDKTLVDNPATTPPDYSRQTWYAPDDVVIHVPQRADGYTLPRATNGGALATIAGTDPPQTVADYLKNAPPDNLLVGVNGGMSTAAGAESLPNSPFYSSIRSNGGLSFVLDGTPVLPEGGRLTVSKPATTDSPIWDSAGGTQTSFSPGKAVLINVALGWTFSVPGVYCAAVTETASMDATDDAPATTLTAKGSYTFVVGDTVDPATVTPCTQPSDGGSGPGDQTRVITDSSHHDIRIFRSGNQFTFGLDTSGPPLSRVLWANTPAPKTVEAPTDTLDMTAVGPVGTKYWYFPHSAVDDTPWPGISAESLSVNDYASPVTFRFLGFSRNGEANPAGVDVAMLADVTTSSRAMSLFNSRLGYPTAFQAPPRTHFHPYWTFTQPGVYCLAIQATGKLADGTWASGDGQITMVVGGAADGVPDPSTVVPCERNGQPLPVAAPNTSVHPVDSTGVYRATNDEFIELGLTDNNLRAVASTTSSVNTPPAYRDPDDVILSTSSYNQQNEAWRYGGDGYKDFGFDLSSLDPARLRGGVATVGLGDVDGPGTVTTANTGDWGTSTSLSSAPGGNSSFTSIGRTRIGAAAAPFFWYFSAAGVYCVPITVDATLTDGTSTHVAKTLTFIAGNTTDPTAADYVNPADVTTCSRGQTGQAATQPGDGDGGGTAGHDDIYVDNDSLTDSGAVILNDGHVDLASKLRDGTLETWVKDTTETTEPRYHPLTGSNALSSPDRDETNNGNGAVFQLLPESQLTVPDNSAYSFLGDPGAPVWVVSQTQQPGLLWPGWSTEEIPTDATQTGVRWKLDRVNGPGEFALYENELASVDVLFNTRDGITDADSLEIAKNAHVHGSWAFSAEGTYCLGFTRSTTLANGATASDDFTLAVAVGRVAVRKVDPGKCFSAPGQPGTQDLTPVPDDQLTDATTGGVQVLDAEHGFNPGQLVTAQIGASHAGEWVSVWLHSAPTWLGWTQVGGSGAIQVRLPSDAEPGAHKLVVKNADLQLLGWDALTLVASSDGDGGGGGDGTPPGGGGQGTPPPQCTAKTTIISSGHLDYSTQVKGGKVESLIGDNSSGQEVFREPSRTVLWLKPSSKVSLPSGYEAVGPAGSTVYMVPQTQNMDLIWLGWSTETLSSATVSGPVTWALTDVDGPGSVKVFLNGEFGGVQSMVFDGKGTYQIATGVHAHANWAFSQPGIYRLHFTQSATLAGGGASADSEVLTIVVGDVDPVSAVPGGAACVDDTSSAGAVGTGGGDATTGGARHTSGTVCTPTRKTVISAGHLDYGSHIVGGKLESLIGDDSTGTRVYREPSQTVLWLKPASKVTLPAGFSQIGGPGQTVWQVPQTQNYDLIWLGWSTELLNAGNAASPVTWQLTSVDGPGTVKVYTTGSFGGVRNLVFDGPGRYSIALGVHAHANWAFSQQGIYRLHFTQTVTLPGGKQSSDSEVLTIAVGDVDPNTATNSTAPGCGTISNTALTGNLPLPEAAAADRQAQADAAQAAAGQLPGVPVATAARTNLVRLLLAVLGGLLVIGSAGTALLWWRRRRWENAAGAVTRS